MDKKPKIVLPFDPRRKYNGDWGEWLYRHRVTLFVSIIVYLLFGIAMVSWRISINANRHKGVIEISFEDIEQLRQEYERQLEINRALSFASGGEVRNAVSNEMGKLNTSIRDAKGIDAAQLYADADDVQRRIQEGGELYQRARQQQTGQQTTTSNSATESNETSRKSGHVTVSYSLGNPVRSAVRLITPSYQCQGGGIVTMNITVNNNGDVVSASVDVAGSNGDDCMARAAKSAALTSRFNVNTSAPSRQTGTITYTFIPQGS